MKDFVESLEKNPMQGDELSPGIRKIRLAIVSKGKGKSGGARVITYTICASESEGRVYLVDVYDKSDFSTVSVSILKKIISESDKFILFIFIINRHDVSWRSIH